MIRVGALSKDLPEFENPGALEALNVIPRGTSYGPLPSFMEIGGAMTARVQGATVARGIGGTLMQIAGDNAKLYRLAPDGTAWNNVTRLSGGAYATPAAGGWSFAHASDLVIAANGADVLQTFTIGSSTNFAALAGSPPVAAYVASAGPGGTEFIVALRLSGFGNRAHWSGFNQPTAWTASQATQSDFKDLKGGNGMGLFGGQYLVALMERAIHRAYYANLPEIWHWDQIAEGFGTPFPRAASQWGGMLYFIAEDGFYVIEGGQAIRPIGHDKIDRFFFNDLNQSFLDRVTSSIDPINGLVGFSYPSKSSTSGTPDKGLLYSWRYDRWARFEAQLEMIHTALSQAGFTLDQLDVFGPFKNLPFSLDSPFWVGAGRPSLAGFSTAHKLGLFSGANMAATVDTQEAQIFPGYKAKVRSVRPMIEGSDGATMPTVRIGGRDRLTDAVIFGAPSTMNAYGTCPLQDAHRYQRARIEIPAGAVWTHALGIDDIEASRAGKR